MLDEEFTARRAAEDRVWRAWYAALVAGCLSLILTGFTASNVSGAGPGLILAALDAVVTLGLGWAMQRWHSPIAAGLLTFRAVTGGAVALTQGSVVRGLVSIGVFGTLYFLGLRGTLALRRPWQPPAAPRPAGGEPGV